MKANKITKRIEFLTFINVLILIGCAFFCGITIGIIMPNVVPRNILVPKIRIVPKGQNTKSVNSQYCNSEYTKFLAQFDRLCEV